jgi:hypothetical protein
MSKAVRLSRQDGRAIITVYHGTDYPYEVLRAGTWVSESRTEAKGYAEACLIANCEDRLWRWFYRNRPWLLRLRVESTQIEWKDGFGDPRYDGKHGTLRVDAPVIAVTELEWDRWANLAVIADSHDMRASCASIGRHYPHILTRQPSVRSKIGPK